MPCSTGASERLADAEVSLEVRMGCGVGACYACSISTRNGRRKVCADGPVFRFGDVLWEELSHVTVATREITVQTRGDGDVLNLTAQVTGFVAHTGLVSGLVVVAVVGSTAGITTIEYRARPGRGSSQGI